MTMFASNGATHQQKAMNACASFCGGFARGLAGRVVAVSAPVAVAAGIGPYTTGWRDPDLGLRGRIRSAAVRTPACA